MKYGLDLSCWFLSEPLLKLYIILCLGFSLRFNDLTKWCRYVVVGFNFRLLEVGLFFLSILFCRSLCLLILCV